MGRSEGVDGEAWGDLVIHHVHVYLVAAKLEFNIEAETPEEARRIALGLAKTNPVKIEPAETAFLAVIPAGKSGAR